jgi:hypothetical protein
MSYSLTSYLEMVTYIYEMQAYLTRTGARSLQILWGELLELDCSFELLVSGY